MRKFFKSTLLVCAALAATGARAWNGDGKASKVLHLYVNDGEIEFADGKKTYIVSFVAWNDKFEEAPKGATLPKAQIPAPTIRVKKGDDVQIVFHNSGHRHLDGNSTFHNVTHTIHLHGLDVISVYDGVPGVPTKDLPDRLLAGVPVGDTYVYRFKADHEGTFMYHCHVDTATHALLGMYGPLIVEGDQPNTIYGHKYDREYTLFFSEVDTEHNDAIRDMGDYDMSKFKTNYYLVNGRIFTADLKNPLSTVADPRSVIKGKEGETVLIRLLAMGWGHTFALHPHAYHMKVVGTDGRALAAPYEKDTLPFMSGERYDVLVKFNHKKEGVCPSCRLGKGISIAHDHNLRAQTSGGKYPKGPLVIFVTE